MDDLATATAATARGEAPPAEATAAAHWLVVSEPVPAGSPSAKLLASMLRAVGLLHGSGAGPDTPRARRAALALFEPGADVAFDRARLMDAVLRAAPRCIVVFGRAPARVLLSTELPLAELRGRVHRLGETPVIVSYAIPYLLRQPADKARAWDDLCLATRACEATR
jgi:DNA polymerase